MLGLPLDSNFHMVFHIYVWLHLLVYRLWIVFIFIYVSLTHFELHGSQKLQDQALFGFIMLELSREDNAVKRWVINVQCVLCVCSFTLYYAYARHYIPFVLLELPSDPMSYFL